MRPNNKTQTEVLPKKQSFPTDRPVNHVGSIRRADHLLRPPSVATATAAAAATHVDLFATDDAAKSLSSTQHTHTHTPVHFREQLIHNTFA